MTTFHRAKYSYSGAIKLFAGNSCHNIYTEFTLICLIPFESYKRTHISAFRDLYVNIHTVNIHKQFFLKQYNIRRTLYAKYQSKNNNFNSGINFYIKQFNIYHINFFGKLYTSLISTYKYITYLLA